MATTMLGIADAKWNPIEHRLFSHISTNWAGKPLRSFELMCAYIDGTTTSTGLTVRADLVRGGNELGERVTNEEMKKLRLKYHSWCPQWNYTLKPRPLRQVELDMKNMGCRCWTDPLT